MPKLPEGHPIGPYRIVRLLGEGGMGEVYEAVNDSIERRVAIKILHPQYAKNPDVTVRFFNEARAANRIEHPGIVQVSDYAQLPDCTAYIVMEFLKGESLASRVHRGNLSFQSVIDIAWQIADALTAAHAKGIVHRDLKPQNVMLVSDPVAPGGERAKILDFGIAKLTQEQTQDTATNALLGTPQYMSPEQCRGAGGVDDKTDVYALGVMLYEMLAGRRPFVADGAGALIIMHVSEEPVPLGKVAPHVPESAVAMVHRLLQKSRKLRPAMQEVLTELRLLSRQSAVTSTAAQQRRTLAAVLGSLRPNPNSTFGFSSGELTVGQELGWRSWLSRLAVVTTLVGGCATLCLLRLHPAKTVTLETKPATAAETFTSAARPADARTDTRSEKPADTTIESRITSEPTGAEVMRKDTTEVLGTTPLAHRQKVQPGQFTPVLRRDGFQQLEMHLPADASGHIDRQLIPLRAKAKPPSPPSRTGLHRRGKPPVAPEAVDQRGGKPPVAPEAVDQRGGKPPVAPEAAAQPPPSVPPAKDQKNDSIFLLEN